MTYNILFESDPEESLIILRGKIPILTLLHEIKLIEDIIPYLRDINFNYIYFNEEGWGYGNINETEPRIVDSNIAAKFLKNRGWTIEEFIDDINYNHLFMDEHFRTNYSAIPEDLAIVMATLNTFKE